MKKLLAILAVAMMISSSFIILCNPEEEQSLPDGFDNINLSSNLDHLYQPVTEGINILDFTNQTDPSEAIIINNAEGLKRLSEIVNNDDISIRNDFSGYSIYLTNDITLEGEWDPIGVSFSHTDIRSFNGTFDGQGYPIYDMQISTAPILENIHVGFFGRTAEDAVIKNTTLVMALISVGSEDSYVFAGGIVGYNKGTIENCAIHGRINVSASIYAYAGGIAGENDGGTIQDCRSVGDINASSSEFTCAGGMVGLNFVGTTQNCYNTISINATSDYDAFAGGIAGYSMVEIQNCYNFVDITVTSTGFRASAGGIAGWSDEAIRDCQNAGYISAITTGDDPSISNTSEPLRSFAGGIVGVNNNVTIQNCFNTGHITAEHKVDLFSYVYAGGIAGLIQYRSAIIGNCYNVGNVEVTAPLTVSDSEAYAGGITGHNYWGTTQNCYNAGNTSASDSPVSGTGGIIGYNFNGTCEDCYYLENAVVEGNNFGEMFNSAGILATGGTLLNALNAWVESRESEEYRFWMNETLPVFTDWLEEAKSSATTLSKNSDGIYELNNAYQLALIANDLNGHYVLLNDIDLSGYSWTPIGNSDSKFTGIFDGNGHTISNLTIAGETQYAGLFGYVGSKGVIKNAGILNTQAYIVFSFNTYSAGIVAYNEGTIQNCYSTGNAHAISSSNAYAGGIAGYNKGTIENCYSVVVTAVSAKSIGHAFMDYIVGKNDGTINSCYAISDYQNHGIGIISFDGSKYVLGDGKTLPDALNDWVKENGTSEFKLWKNELLPAFCETWGEAAIAYGVEFTGNEINSEFELGAFANYVDLNDSSSISAILTKDLDLSFYEWAPIGNSDSRFTGTFDGNGYELFNLKITGDVQYAGFFSHIGTGGTVKNLRLIDSVVFTNSNTSVMAAGGIAASNEGTIDNCRINGDVTVTSMRYTLVGGIAGLNEGIINACYITGNVTGISDIIEDDNIPNIYLGGITGFNGDTILSCSIVGNTTVISARYAHVGGIAGENIELINNCYNLGDVTAISAYRAFAGGIAGENIDTIENCYNTGDVSASSGTSAAYAGGIAADGCGEYTSIRNCYNIGDVTAESESASAFASGISGENRNALIENCYNTGDITAFTPYYAYSAGIVSINYGTVQNCYNAGDVNIFSNSIFAFAAGIAAENNVLIKDCQNVGNVNIVANSSSNPPAVDASDIPIFTMGGIVGLNHSAIIQNCYSQGSIGSDIQLDEYIIVSAGGIVGHTQGASALIQNCYNVGDMKIDMYVTDSEYYVYVGGIAGYNAGSIPIDEGTTTVTIQNCYNAGNIAASSNSINLYVGGIVGNSDGIEENNYYLENTVTDGGNDIGITFNSSGILATGESLLNVLNEWVNNDNSFINNHHWMIGSVNGMSLPVFTDWLREAEDMGVMMIPNDDGIYEITHPYQLALIANDLNGHYILLNDIDLSGYSWTPIGNSDSKFTGTFDGQGHEITNMIVSGDIQYAGLFGCIGYTGVIKNVNVFHALIDVDSSSPTWADIIAGQNNGTIENSFGLGIVNSDLKMSEIDEDGKDNTTHYILAAVVVVLIVMALAGLLRKKD